MTPAPLHCGGERLLLDPSGALVWPARQTVVVADLHLEKGTALAERGQLVPPWDTGATLARLAQVLHRYRPAHLIFLGDSFHDRRAARRMQDADLERLRGLVAGLNAVWIAGNHDPAAPNCLPGRGARELALGSLLFRHEAQGGGGHDLPVEISGHHHPKARIVTRAGAISRPCFVAAGRRVILPAFGAYTGGIDVGHPAIARLFPRGGRAFLLGKDRLFSFTLAQQRDRAAT